MKKTDVITKEDIELYYKKCRKIRFNSTTTHTVEQILSRLIYINESYPSATVYSRGGFHCDAEKYRSLDDIIKVVKYYHPELTVKQILIDISKYKDGDLYFRYCPSIKKYNFAGRAHYAGSFKAGMKYFNMKGQGFRNCDITLHQLIS